MWNWYLDKLGMIKETYGYIQCILRAGRVFVLLVWISNQRQAEGKVEKFGSIYIILVPRQKFTEENKEVRRI
jgi:hypothetical protein